MSSNLINLRDRCPDLFPRRGLKLSWHEFTQIRARSLAAKRQLNAAKTTGTGKTRMWAARFAKYRASLYAMVFHDEIAAELARKEAEAAAKADAESQLTQTGGIEGSPANG